MGSGAGGPSRRALDGDLIVLRIENRKEANMLALLIIGIILLALFGAGRVGGWGIRWLVNVLLIVGVILIIVWLVQRC